MNFLWSLALILSLRSIILVKSGCCNENLWCDGDPSFREQPIVSQWPNSTQVTITWSEAYIHLVKCVDYFFVQYAPSDANHQKPIGKDFPFFKLPIIADYFLF